MNDGLVGVALLGFLALVVTNAIWAVFAANLLLNCSGLYRACS